MTVVLAWTALHALWQVAVVGALVAVVRSLVSPRRPDWRYRVVLIGIVLSLAVPVVTGGLLATRTVVSGAASAPSAAQLAALVTESAAVLTARRLAVDVSGASAWILGVWGVASGCAFLVLLGGHALGRRRRRRARPAPPEWRSAGRRVARRLGLRQAVPVLVSDAVEDPVLVGIRAPAVLVPAVVVDRLSGPEIDAVLTHELAHAVRRDHLALPLLAAARCVFCFHPAVRWLGRIAEFERERAADDLVLAGAVDPAVYAGTLCRIEELRRPSGRLHPALSARGGNLLDRVRRIAEGAPRRDGAGVAALAPAVVLLWLGLGGAVPLSLDVLHGRVMTISAADPAGDFRLQFLDGRLIRADVGGRRLGSSDWSQHGPVITVLGPASAPFEVYVRPDGISWRPRPAAVHSTTQP